MHNYIDNEHLRGKVKLQYHKVDGLAVIQLDNPPVNALSMELIENLHNVLIEIIKYFLLYLSQPLFFSFAYQ